MGGQVTQITHGNITAYAELPAYQTENEFFKISFEHPFLQEQFPGDSNITNRDRVFKFLEELGFFTKSFRGGLLDLSAGVFKKSDGEEYFVIAKDYKERGPLSITRAPSIQEIPYKTLKLALAGLDEPSKAVVEKFLDQALPENQRSGQLRKHLSRKDVGQPMRVFRMFEESHRSGYETRYFQPTDVRFFPQTIKSDGDTISRIPKDGEIYVRVPYYCYFSPTADHLFNVSGKTWSGTVWNGVGTPTLDKKALGNKKNEDGVPLGLLTSFKREEFVSLMQHGAIFLDSGEDLKRFKAIYINELATKTLKEIATLKERIANTEGYIRDGYVATQEEQNQGKGRYDPRYALNIKSLRKDKENLRKKENIINVWKKDNAFTKGPIKISYIPPHNSDDAGSYKVFDLASKKYFIIIPKDDYFDSDVKVAGFNMPKECAVPQTYSKQGLWINFSNEAAVNAAAEILFKIGVPDNKKGKPTASQQLLTKILIDELKEYREKDLEKLKPFLNLGFDTIIRRTDDLEKLELSSIIGRAVRYYYILQVQHELIFKRTQKGQLSKDGEEALNHYREKRDLYNENGLAIDFQRKYPKLQPFFKIDEPSDMTDKAIQMQKVIQAFSYIVMVMAHTSLRSGDAGKPKDFKKEYVDLKLPYPLHQLEVQAEGYEYDDKFIPNKTDFVISDNTTPEDFAGLIHTIFSVANGGLLNQPSIDDLMPKTTPEDVEANFFSSMLENRFGPAKDQSAGDWTLFGAAMVANGAGAITTAGLVENQDRAQAFYIFTAIASGMSLVYQLVLNDTTEFDWVDGLVNGTSAAVGVGVTSAAAFSEEPKVIREPYVPAGGLGPDGKPQPGAVRDNPSDTFE
jgi:hypothetical protein